MQEITEETARKPAADEVLRQISRGEVDLDMISEVIRSAEVVIRSYAGEVEGLRRDNEQLQSDYQKERNAVDDLVKRLASLHEENRLARGVFTAEIEGRRSVLGLSSTLDLEALDMEGLIRERENVQRAVGKTLGLGGNTAGRR
jgi:FtsZ-binding cell division protein ZapB